MKPLKQNFLILRIIYIEGFLQIFLQPILGVKQLIIYYTNYLIHTTVMAPSLNKRSLFFMETATGVFLLDSLKNVVDFMWEHRSTIIENAKLTVLSCHSRLPSKADLCSLGRYKAWGRSTHIRLYRYAILFYGIPWYVNELIQRVFCTCHHSLTFIL